MGLISSIFGGSSKSTSVAPTTTTTTTTDNSVKTGDVGLTGANFVDVSHAVAETQQAQIAATESIARDFLQATVYAAANQAASVVALGQLQAQNARDTLTTAAAVAQNQTPSYSAVPQAANAAGNWPLIIAGLVLIYTLAKGK